MQAQAGALLGVQNGTLTFSEIFKILNYAEQEVGMVPYEGTGLPGAPSNPLSQKFCLVIGSEDWNNFVDDPWLLQNRPLNMNIVTDVFRGDLWGRVTCKLERYPWRWKLDANASPTFERPELSEVNSSSEDYGLTKPNPQYSKVANSPIGVAFLVGGDAYDAIQVGPPPSEFTRDLPQGAVQKMNWNGKAYMTKLFNVPCKDADGNTFYDANSFGRYLRLQGTVTVGARAQNPRNVLPIIFKRRTPSVTVA
jgi:hypothetical protein